jgi:hypothetical protein
MAIPVISIGSKLDGKGFKQAETALGKLNKTVKGVASTLGLVYGTQAVVAFGKASVKAFTEDEAAAKRLALAVTNLGIGFANPAIAKYIAQLEKTTGIQDDYLRPSFQALLTTTGSLTKAQTLLSNAIQISRASGIDLVTVADDLGKGYIGITKGLTKYNTGLSKAELQTKSFSEVLSIMLARSSGAAQDYLDSTAYKFDVLTVATSNASEIIGGGLVDAFALLAGGTDASDAATAIEGIATALAHVERGIGRTLGAIPTLISNLKNLPKDIFQGFAGKAAGVTINPPKAKEVKLTLTQKKQQELMAKLEKEALKREKERLALKNKQLQTSKLQAAIDKANLALGKSGDIFDIDKIEIAAALTNQAEALGKATTFAQQLQIANDSARLRVKQDILALEDAIASKDEASIVAATAKLNKDLEVLSALSGQNLKLADIKSILDSLKPTDLINLTNLQSALDMITKMLALLATANAASTAKVPTSASLGSGIPSGDYVAPVSMKDALAASPDALIEYADAAAARANAFADLLDLQNQADQLALDEFTAKLGLGSSASTAAISSTVPVATAAAIQSGNRYAAQAANYYNITVQGSVLSEQDLTQVVQNAVQQNNRYGNNLNVAGAI